MKYDAKYRIALLAGAKTTVQIIEAFNTANQCNMHPTNVGQAAARLGQIKYASDLYSPLAVSLIFEDLLRLLIRRRSFEQTPPIALEGHP
jgi:hypothetical protein